MPLAEIPLCVWRTRGLNFSFRGQTIRYWSAGQGEPLLLIHGFPTASWDWHYLWAPLAQRFRVIACDMLGFGDSAKPLHHDYSLLEQADLQQALLAHLQVEQPVHVLGHDYGGSVAQELLARHHEGRVQIASCVFLNGGLFPERHRPLMIQKLLLSRLGWLVGRSFGRDDLVRHVTQIYGPCTHPSESALDDYWSLIASNRGTRILHKLIAYLPERVAHRERWVGAMQAEGVPLRLINGAVDPVSGAHMLERYQELVPNADTVMLQGIGHYPHTEAPVQVLRHYLAFREQPLVSVPQKVAWS
ncbi:alpha/beta fold hydrolase [Pseudomonas sp. NPDC087612]|uniref:alpha/beta fold hydrolase n=1 Tax=unclassified Pseudomonas TaxID=196821 RepID=UPI00088FF91C|nr:MULTISPECIES: alpha/beta hydrolase [unclassified Pseudomonas]QPG65296.1 alpha/beta hydrolase [Pseudomonas sp. BIGb0427]QVM95957.1 alpha/beta hydrolase [Pseudomonas sp. SORT22]UVL57178.1 alpha/beta hydrolase [Pseudomonas sp. B21-035]UVM67736.1 alpha/beta hydrolase [Pseudomonas sp. B21-009]SDR12297.1 Pimeloyl-ACP methyl ester carboxylesterase [Pseudomonas sp. UC 17F4]